MQNYLISRALGLLAGTIVTVASCATPSPTTDLEHRSTPATSLPSFAHRTNPGNDGTKYEPCDLNDINFEALRWSRESRSDVATVDGQTGRGCTWKDLGGGTNWELAQIVSNSPSLIAYKEANPSFRWLPDIDMVGRVVSVYQLDPQTCATRVQVQRAGVSTVVGFAGRPAPPTSQICDRAIAFTRATISQMPV